MNPPGPDTVGPNCKRQDIPQTKVERKDTTVCPSIGKRPSPAPKPIVLRKFPADKSPCRKLVGVETVTGICPMKRLI
jgi:hypothetical protein